MREFRGLRGSCKGLRGLERGISRQDSSLLLHQTAKAIFRALQMPCLYKSLWKLLLDLGSTNLKGTNLRIVESQARHAELELPVAALLGVTLGLYIYICIGTNGKCTFL